MAWQLYEIQNGDLAPNFQGFVLDLPKDTSKTDLLAATVNLEWHSHDDSDGTNV